MPLATELIEHRNKGQNAAVIFVYGFTGKPENTWADFATFLFLAAEKAVSGWDLFSVGYSTNLRIDLTGIWSADPDLAWRRCYCAQRPVCRHWVVTGRSQS